MAERPKNLKELVDLTQQEKDLGLDIEHNKEQKKKTLEDILSYAREKGHEDLGAAAATAYDLAIDPENPGLPGAGIVKATGKGARKVSREAAEKAKSFWGDRAMDSAESLVKTTPGPNWRKYDFGGDSKMRKQLDEAIEHYKTAKLDPETKKMLGNAIKEAKKQLKLK